MTAHDLATGTSWAVIDRPYNSDASRFQFTCWAQHDFTDQTVLPGEIRTSGVGKTIYGKRV